MRAALSRPVLVAAAAALVAAVAAALVAAAHLRRPAAAAERFTGLVPERITCVMVTGKDAAREPLARLAVRNFAEQDYPNKRLLIINHGPFACVAPGAAAPAGVTEVRVAKAPPHATLGALRNRALDMLAPGELWAVWDDDDHRAPDYLSRLHAALASARADLVYYTDRIEYNANTGLVWRAHVPWGSVHVLARQHPRVRYMADRDTMEDVELVDDHRRAGLRVVALDSARFAAHYVRLVHGTANTSLYVAPDKTELAPGREGGYQELPATAGERAAVAAWLASGALAALQMAKRIELA